MNLQEEQMNGNNTVDIIFQSVLQSVPTTDSEGNQTYTKVMDDLSLWCKTLTVSSNKLSQLIYEMMELIRNSMYATKNMCIERAQMVINECMELANSVKKACDSKSSESVRDGNNSQSTIIDKLNRNSVEKIYTMKENVKKSMWDSIMGKEKDKMTDD